MRSVRAALPTDGTSAAVMPAALPPIYMPIPRPAPAPTTAAVAGIGGGTSTTLLSRSFDKAEALRILREAFEEIPAEEWTGLARLIEEWERDKPFAGKKVLLNCHLTRSTLIMVYALLIAGAELDVSATSELVVHSDIQEILVRAGIPFYSPLPPSGDYDVTLDCAAGLVGKIRPKIGSVELTHVDPRVYEGLDYPIISADYDSITKNIETYYGTGDGCRRALIAHERQQWEEIISSMEQELERLMLAARQARENYGERSIELAVLLRSIAARREQLAKLLPEITEEEISRKLFNRGRKFVIFGFGKVGKGIVQALLASGVLPEDITFIDRDKGQLLKSLSFNLGFTPSSRSFIYFKDSSPEKLAESCAAIRRAVHEASTVITATGVEGLVSRYFERGDFRWMDPETGQERGPLLVNMGTPDEWGVNFSDKDILNNKKPANFGLQKPEPPRQVLFLARQKKPEQPPTRVIFLGPIFECLLRIAAYLVSLSLSPVPEEETSGNETSADDASGDEACPSFSQLDKKIHDGLNPIPKSIDLRVIRRWFAENSLYLTELAERSGRPKAGFMDFVDDPQAVSELIAAFSRSERFGTRRVALSGSPRLTAASSSSSLSSRVLEVPASAVGAGSGGGGTPPRSSQASRDAATHLSPSRGLIPGEGGSGESAGAGSEASAHSIASAASTALPSPAVSEEAEEDRPSSRERELECCGGERRGQLRDPSTEGLMDALTLAAGGRAECRREGINPSPTAALRAPPFPRSVSADNLQLQPEAAQKLREDAADTAAAAMAAAHRAPRPMVSSCRPVGALR